MKTTLFALIFLFWAAFANAATYHVDKAGSDSNGCTDSPTHLTTGAKLTVAAGLTCLSSGDTLVIGIGTWNETIGYLDIPAGVNNSQRTIISGVSRTLTIFQPTSIAFMVIGVRQTFSGGAYVPTWITLTNFRIDASLGANGTGCIDASRSTNIINVECHSAARDGIHVPLQDVLIQDSLITDCGRINFADFDTKGGGIHANGNGDDENLANPSNLIIEGTTISGCRGGGIWVQQNGAVRNITIRNNVIKNFGTGSTWPQGGGSQTTQGGVAISSGHGQDYFIYNNLVFNDNHTAQPLGTDACFFLWGDSRGTLQNVHIYNNTCYGMSAPGDGATGNSAGIWSWEYHQPEPIQNVIAQNNIFSNALEVWRNQDATGTIANSITNPTFAGAPITAGEATDSFKLLSGSAGVNQGVSLASFFTTDFYGTTRPQGSAWDVGFHEFAATAPPPTVVINSPTTAGTYVTNSGTVNISGLGTGTISTCQWVNDRGGSGNCTGTAPFTTWSVSGIVLEAERVNTLTVTVTDNLTQQAAATLQVAYSVQALVGAWGFEEGAGTTAADSSGFGNTATIDGASWTSSGKFGNALSFDGTNDQLTVAHSDSLNIIGGFTIVAQVLPTAVTTAWKAILSKDSTATPNDWGSYWAYATVGDPHPGCGTSNPTVGFQDPSNAANNRCSTIPLQIQWTCLCATYDGVNLRLWVNKVNVETTAVTRLVEQSSGVLRIGNSQFSEFFAGTIDEVRVYNYALNQAAIDAACDSSITSPPSAVTGLKVGAGTLRLGPGSAPLKLGPQP